MSTIKGVDFNGRIDSKGQLNFLGAVKQSNTAPPAPSNNGPSKLPNVKGTIHLEDVTGTFQDDVDHVTVGLPQQSPLNVTVAIKDINQPIEDSVDLGLQLDEKDLVKVKVEGTVSAIQNNLVDTDKLAANQTIELSEGDLAAVSQVLHAMHLDLDVTGKMNGKITATVNTMDNISADMGINFADLSAGGKQLAGDTIAIESCQVGLKASVTATGGKNAQIKLDLPIVMQTDGIGRGESCHGSCGCSGRFADGDGQCFPGNCGATGENAGCGATSTAAIPGAGDISISADFNVADLVNQLPHTLPMEKGTSLTSGTLTHETMITLANGRAVIATETQLKNFAGMANGSAVRVADVDATASLTAVGGDHPDLADIKLGLDSAFADVKGGGATLGKLNVQGTSDLKNLQQQISQFFDLDALMQAPAGSHVSLSGTLAFDAHTDGDLTADESDIGFGADFSATAIKIDIPGRRSINEPKLVAMIAANLHHAGSQLVEAVTGLKIGVQSPAVNFAADGDFKLGGKLGVEVSSFKISQGTVDLRLAQEEFGGALSMFVPKPVDGQPPSLAQRIADNSVRVASGSLNIEGGGSFGSTGGGFSQQLQVQVQPIELTIVDEMGTAQTAHVPTISLVIYANGTVDDQSVATVKDFRMQALVYTERAPLLDLMIAADASVPLGSQGTMSASRIELVKLDGDLPGLQSAMGPLIPLVMPSPTTADNAPSVVQMLATNQLVCCSGKLSGSMVASFDGKTMTISKPLTIGVAGLTMVEHGVGSTAGQDQNVVNNETVQITAAAATAAGDMSAVHDLNVGVDTSFAKIRLSNGQVVLAKSVDGKLVPVGPFDQLQSVNVEVDDVDLARLDAVVNQLFNQAAAPRRARKSWWLCLRRW